MKKVIFILAIILGISQVALCQILKNTSDLLSLTAPVHSFLTNKMLNLNEDEVLELSNKLTNLKNHFSDNQISEEDNIETKLLIQKYLGFDNIETFVEYNNKVRELVLKIKEEALPTNSTNEELKGYFKKIFDDNVNIFQGKINEEKMMDCKGNCNTAFLIESGASFAYYLIEAAECAALTIPFLQIPCAIVVTETYVGLQVAAVLVHRSCLKKCK